MKKTASIVIPVFKTEDYLCDCINSLLCQTYKLFDIVIVDDGSPGDCRAIVERFQRVRSGVKYIRSARNHGVFHARLVGAEGSTSDYVGFLDPDDRARPEFVETLLSAASDTGADIIGSAAYEANIRPYFMIKGIEEVIEAYNNRSIPDYNVWTKLYKREFLLNIPDLRSIACTSILNNSDDLLLNVLCALRDPLYVNVPYSLVDHNKNRENSATNPTCVADVLRIIDTSSQVYHMVQNAADKFGIKLDYLLSRSMEFNYKKIRNVNIEYFDTAMLRLDESLSSNIYLKNMIRLAERERREAKQRLDATKRKLLAEREKLAAERAERRQLRSKLVVEREKLAAERAERRQLHSKLKRIGFFKALATWRLLSTFWRRFMASPAKRLRR